MGELIIVVMDFVFFFYYVYIDYVWEKFRV